MLPFGPLEVKRKRPGSFALPVLSLGKDCWRGVSGPRPLLEDL